MYGLMDGNIINEPVCRCITGLAVVIASSDIMLSNAANSSQCQFSVRVGYEALHTSWAYISYYQRGESGCSARGKPYLP